MRPAGKEALALHFNAFHVLQTLNAVDADLDAGVPARGLHGEAYDGHVFWDELFVYPFITLRRPRLTSALLAYRHRRLGAARAAAARAGHAGAMFPWQSGIAGDDVTPRRLFNPLNEQWMPDNSSLQRHVGLAVAFSAWQYYESTGDTQFLLHEGADLIVEIARFFASLAVYDPARDRYSIDHVMGPDEFHDGYLDRPGEGVRDNVYTNVMTAWVLRKPIATVDVLRRHPGGLAWKRLDIVPGSRKRGSASPADSPSSSTTTARSRSSTATRTSNPSTSTRTDGAMPVSVGSTSSSMPRMTRRTATRCRSSPTH